jgi:hypothetical protein
MEDRKQLLISMMQEDEKLGLYDDTKSQEWGFENFLATEDDAKISFANEIKQISEYDKGRWYGRIEGAKWQQEHCEKELKVAKELFLSVCREKSKMFSEEEAINLIKQALIHEPNDEIRALTDGKNYVRENNFNCWFEKHKK